MNKLKWVTSPIILSDEHHFATWIKDRKKEYTRIQSRQLQTPRQKRFFFSFFSSRKYYHVCFYDVMTMSCEIKTYGRQFRCKKSHSDFKHVLGWCKKKIIGGMFRWWFSAHVQRTGEVYADERMSAAHAKANRLYFVSFSMDWGYLSKYKRNAQISSRFIDPNQKYFCAEETRATTIIECTHFNVDEKKNQCHIQN